jgi:hypothetical protein
MQTGMKINASTAGIAAALLLVGLLGHVLAAGAMGGSRIAYIHHVAGFFIIAAVTGLLLLGLARLFWRGRHGVTLLAFAAVQALFGLAVYATPAQSPRTTAPLNPSVEFLLTSAATDFRTQRPPLPARFRDVHSGYVIAPDGARQYRLCGEFLPAQESGKAEWTPFATLKTSGYEQWLGAQAESFCKRSGVTWEKEDWSSSLQSRVDSLGSEPGR